MRCISRGRRMLTGSGKTKPNQKKSEDKRTSEAKPQADAKAPVSKGSEATSEAEDKKAPKRVPQNTLKLQFAGELVLVKNPLRDLSGLFRRYEALFETFANMERHERLINYKFLNALML